MIDQARFRAQLALLRADCRQYLTGPDFQPPDDRDPQQVAVRAEIVPGPVPAGQPAGAVASSPIRGGVRGKITVHPDFFAADPGLPISPAAAFAPSADQQRTIAVLHEIGHLTGREGDHNGDLPRQFDYNATILNLCLLGPPLEITAFSCDGDGSDYYRHYSCYLSWTGGTDPDQVQISSNTGMARRTNHYDENYVTLEGTCRGVNNPYVSATVFDSGGRRADAYLYAFC
ncbi:hypothetical protein GCM10022254_63590 [Actinomadura meridiana]|uniref:Uncharacterized protein n=1 Tax=Actinomadura meridiana TaxID=559626 RepID=A0ABP8CJI9_9ACTN